MPDATPSTLLSLASHELRGPTGVARGYLRLLEQDPALPERAQRAVVETAKALSRVAALLDEVSELARIATGEVRLSRRESSLQALVEAAAEAIRFPEGQDIQLRGRRPHGRAGGHGRHAHPRCASKPCFWRWRAPRPARRSSTSDCRHPRRHAGPTELVITLRMPVRRGRRRPPARPEPGRRRPRPGDRGCRRPGPWRADPRAVGRRAVAGVCGDAGGLGA